MIRATLLVPCLAFALAGCDLLFPEDFREGDEAQDICVGRVRADMTYERYNELETATGDWVPSYTYDVTKLDFEAVKALSVEGSDETAGTRLMQETNHTSTAVQRFKAMDVTEKGAFFLGREPSLYRVRGKRQKASEIIANGCKRQQTNMRLIDLNWKRPSRKVSVETLRTLKAIEEECETAPLTLVETKNGARLKRPSSDQNAPLSPEKSTCVERLLQERLSKKLEK